YEVYSKNGEKKEKEVKKFDWTQEEGEKEEHDHYMIKEIKEQPKVAKRLLKTFKTSQKKDLNRFLDLIEDHEKVIFTSAGTSYHASLLGVYYLQKAGVEAQALIASEFQNYERVDEDTLVIAVSQSGETMDVLEAIEFSKEKGGTIASIVNVPHSSIQRKSKESLEIHAGQEVCVAATKTFTNQVLTLTKIAERLGMDSNIAGISEEIKEVIERNEEEVKELAKELSDKEDIYVLGRGTTYPVSREIALKLKEIPYIHAEGMMGGELKHGTLALIEEGTPVISLIPQESDEIISNVKEVEARGANSLRISSGSDRFYLPENPSSFALSSTTIGFLLAYYIAKEKGRPIDKPRNLAKSVTVK
ncbi:MAG: SIS domain-containing protein, partial [Candidatus Nanohaloarchaeota archaeon QJJ-9]|nr:SIS domain-containing protein [Candidatus Nanohaloarchaeota archaeon QJJ-9]